MMRDPDDKIKPEISGRGADASRSQRYNISRASWTSTAPQQQRPAPQAEGRFDAE